MTAYVALMYRRHEVERWPVSPRQTTFLKAIDKGLDALEEEAVRSAIAHDAPRQYTLWERFRQWMSQWRSQ